MNTPKTRTPKRWSYTKKENGLPEGLFQMDLTNDKFIHALGRIASLWPHTEARMLGIFSTLLHPDAGVAPTRQLYYSIVNAQIRIQIMKNVLEGSFRNRGKGAEYDDIIDEYAALNTLRNKYPIIYLTHQFKPYILYI